MEKAYSDNLFECPVDVNHVSGIGANSMSWRSDSEDAAESGPCSVKVRTRGKLLVLGVVEKVGAVTALDFQYLFDQLSTLLSLLCSEFPGATCAFPEFVEHS